MVNYVQQNFNHDYRGMKNPSMTDTSNFILSTSNNSNPNNPGTNSPNLYGQRPSQTCEQNNNSNHAYRMNGRQKTAFISSDQQASKTNGYHLGQQDYNRQQQTLRDQPMTSDSQQADETRPNSHIFTSTNSNANPVTTSNKLNTTNNCYGLPGSSNLCDTSSNGYHHIANSDEDNQEKAAQSQGDLNNRSINLSSKEPYSTKGLVSKSMSPIVMAANSYQNQSSFINTNSLQQQLQSQILNKNLNHHNSLANETTTSSHFIDLVGLNEPIPSSSLQNDHCSPLLCSSAGINTKSYKYNLVQTSSSSSNINNSKNPTNTIVNTSNNNNNNITPSSIANNNNNKNKRSTEIKTDHEFSSYIHRDNNVNKKYSNENPLNLQLNHDNIFERGSSNKLPHRYNSQLSLGITNIEQTDEDELTKTFSEPGVPHEYPNKYENNSRNYSDSQNNQKSQDFDNFDTMNGDHRLADFELPKGAKKLDKNLMSQSSSRIGISNNNGNNGLFMMKSSFFTPRFNQSDQGQNGNDFHPGHYIESPKIQRPISSSNARHFNEDTQNLDNSQSQQGNASRSKYQENGSFIQFNGYQDDPSSSIIRRPLSSPCSYESSTKDSIDFGCMQRKSPNLSSQLNNGHNSSVKGTGFEDNDFIKLPVGHVRNLKERLTAMVEHTGSLNENHTNHQKIFFSSSISNPLSPSNQKLHTSNNNFDDCTFGEYKPQQQQRHTPTQMTPLPPPISSCSLKNTPVNDSSDNIRAYSDVPKEPLQTFQMENEVFRKPCPPIPQHNVTRLNRKLPDLPIQQDFDNYTNNTFLNEPQNFSSSSSDVLFNKISEMVDQKIKLSIDKQMDVVKAYFETILSKIDLPPNKMEESKINEVKRVPKLTTLPANCISVGGVMDQLLNKQDSEVNLNNYEESTSSYNRTEANNLYGKTDNSPRNMQAQFQDHSRNQQLHNEDNLARKMNDPMPNSMPKCEPPSYDAHMMKKNPNISTLKDEYNTPNLPTRENYPSYTIADEIPICPNCYRVFDSRDLLEVHLNDCLS